MYGAIQTQFAGELVMKSLQSAVNQERISFSYTQKGIGCVQKYPDLRELYRGCNRARSLAAIDPRDQHPHVCFINGFRKLASAAAAQGPRFPQYVQDSFNTQGFACCDLRDQVIAPVFFLCIKKDYML